jgi:adenosylcobinamide kinase/adenosylcobinamide-phosphate guanylyltransferase
VAVASLVVIGGGARSGKSAFALARARRLGERRVFLATAQAYDAEMGARIARHVAERDPSFRTVEVAYDLAQALASLEDVDVAVVDCLTLWLSNLLVRGDSDETVERAIESLRHTLLSLSFCTVLVTNEVGMGIVPDNELARRFRDLAGRAHRTLAAVATELHFAVLGCIVRLRPEPLTIVTPG